MKAEIGLIGLGVMGANLALNIAEKGFRIAVYNRTWATTEKFMADAGPLANNIVACRTYAELADAIAAPRPVIILVKAGEAVDEQIKKVLDDPELRKQFDKIDKALRPKNIQPFKDLII